MKKKIFILLGVLLLIVTPSFLFAQTYGNVKLPVFSLENTISFYLFPNALDGAFNLQPYPPESNFNSLTSDYLFGGLSNFNWAWTTPVTLTDFRITLPVTVGFYKHGKMPWSIISSGYASTTSSGLSNGTSVTTTTKTTGTAPTFTSHTWVTQTTEEQYKWLDAANLDFGGQFLIGIGGIDIGLGVKYYLEQNASGAAVATWANNNRTEIQTFYYDTNAADATAAPNAAVDYTITSTWNEPDTLSEIYLVVPFMMQLGQIGLAGSASMDITNRDGTTFSTAAAPTDPTTKTYSNPHDTGPGATYTNIEQNSLVDKEQTISIGANTSVTLPPIVNGNKNNKFVLGLSGNVDINKKEPEVDTYTTQTYNYAGGGAAPTRSTRSEFQDTTNYNGFLFYTVEVSTAHYFYFDLSPATLGFAPKLSTAIGSPASLAPSKFYKTTEHSVTRTDGDNDGAFTSAADTITTTDTTYTNNNDGNPFEVKVYIGLPASLKVRPKGWVFGMTFGANLGVQYSIQFVTDNQDTQTTHTVTTDGTGATLNDTTTTAVSGSYSTSKVNQAWTFTNQSLFGLNFFLPGNATLDVILNTNNLFVFDKLVAQLSIPL